MGAEANGSIPWPERRTSFLRTGRVSLPGESYFVTAVTKDRVPVFSDPVIAQTLCDVLLRMDADGDLRLLAATVMPDHVHLLFELGDRLSVGRVCGKFKTLGRSQGRANWHWQQHQFEHRLRPNESRESYGLYVFLNAYRARLIDLEARWPWWMCPRPEGFRFVQTLRAGGTPQPEWLGQCERLAQELHVGE